MPTVIEVVKEAQQATKSWDWETVLDHIATEDKYIIPRYNDVKRAMETLRTGKDYATNHDCPRAVRKNRATSSAEATTRDGNATYNKRKASGLCTKCGLSKPVPGKLKCERCTQLIKVRDAGYWQKHKNKNLGVIHKWQEAESQN